MNKRMMKRQNIFFIAYYSFLLTGVAPVSAQYMNMSKTDFLREAHQADLFMNETHQDAAKKIYEVLVRTKWVTAHEYTQLAYAYLYAIPSKRDFELSENCARKAIHLAPEYGPALAALAHALLEQNNYEGCIKFATRAINCKQPDTHAFYLRARGYAALHQYKEAIADLEHWDKIISKTDKVQQTFLMEGEIFERMGNADEAIRRYKLAAPYHPEDSVKSIVRVLKNAKRYPEAIAEINILIKRNSADSDAYNTRGEFKALSKDWKGAVEDYTHAIDLSPTSTYYRNRAKAYQATGLTALAKKDFVNADK